MSSKGNEGTTPRAAMSQLLAALSVLQININHCRLAQDLMFQNVVRRGVDITIASKSYHLENVVGQYTDHSGLVANWYESQRLIGSEQGRKRQRISKVKYQC